MLNVLPEHLIHPLRFLRTRVAPLNEDAAISGRHNGTGESERRAAGEPDAGGDGLPFAKCIRWIEHDLGAAHLANIELLGVCRTGIAENASALTRFEFVELMHHEASWPKCYLPSAFEVEPD